MYRIAIGVGAGKVAAAAADWVIDWHRSPDAQITLVTAFDYLVEEVDEDAARLEREAARIQAALPGAVVETELADGSVPGVLECRSRVTDLLVVGTHRDSRTPVCVVPTGWTPGNGE